MLLHPRSLLPVSHLTLAVQPMKRRKLRDRRGSKPGHESQKRSQSYFFKQLEAKTREETARDLALDETNESLHNADGDGGDDGDDGDAAANHADNDAENVGSERVQGQGAGRERQPSLQAQLLAQPLPRQTRRTHPWLP